MALNFFFIIILIIDLLSPITVDSQTFSINVWPKPTNVSWALPAAAPLSSSFKIYSPRHLHLRSAVARYSRLILSERYRPILPPALNLSASPSVRSLFISVSDLSVPLQHGIDESYTLSIAHSVAKISSSTPWGAMRGLESFSQLVWGDPPVVAVGIYITDRPIFAHRGVMLDTARNFYPVRDILRTISAMSANKLNVFHWHITDSQSFPIGLPSEPKLAAKGSHGDGMVYSSSDVKAIVEFGMNHGVRVLPEIDAPGHTGSWAGAYPAIVACANKFWLPPGTDWADRLASEPGTGQLNPLNPQTYQVVHNVHRNLATLFPEFLLHAGGDEIIPGCWKSDPTIQSFLSNGGTLSQLLATFVNETHPYILSLNRTAVYWEDVLLDDVINVAGQSVLETSTTILQTWNKGPNNTRRIVGMGYRVIVSSSDFYYLDCGHGDFVGNDSSYDGDGSDMGTDGGSWCGPYKTWQRVYDYDIAYGLSEREAELVMGGEVALWSEQADGVVVDGRLWPRAAAMAEALWSGNRGRDGRKRYADATDRLIDWRDRMVGRGIRAEPLQPLWCRMHPGMCNLVQ